MGEKFNARRLNFERHCTTALVLSTPYLAAPLFLGIQRLIEPLTLELFSIIFLQFLLWRLLRPLLFRPAQREPSRRRRWTAITRMLLLGMLVLSLMTVLRMRLRAEEFYLVLVGVCGLGVTDGLVWHGRGEFGVFTLLAAHTAVAFLSFLALGQGWLWQPLLASLGVSCNSTALWARSRSRTLYAILVVGGVTSLLTLVYLRELPFEYGLVVLPLLAGFQLLDSRRKVPQEEWESDAMRLTALLPLTLIMIMFIAN